MKSNEPLAPILETPGFRNIAEAIRRSTIVPQYRGRGESEYDIRYGLGQDLKRNASYNDEFIAALSEFMQRYNAENARVYEKTGRQYRKNILTTDVEDVVRLVDRHGATTVGNLAAQALATGRLDNAGDIRTLVRNSVELIRHTPKQTDVWDNQEPRYLDIQRKTQTMDWKG